MAQVLIGLIYDDLGEKQKALEFYNQALPLRRAVGDHAGEATTLSNIGIVYRDTKQPIEAIKMYEQSATLTLQLRNNVGKENRKTFLESERGTAVALIDLLIDQNQPERAFEWANLATVADLADYTRLVNAKVANPEAQKAIDKWNQKNIQLESLRKDLQPTFRTLTVTQGFIRSIYSMKRIKIDCLTLRSRIIYLPDMGFTFSITSNKF